jgi:glutamate carboxypeptidase
MTQNRVAGIPREVALTDTQAKRVQAWLQDHQSAMLSELQTYVEIESPSDDQSALETCLIWLRSWLDDSLSNLENEEILRRDGAGDILIRRYAGTSQRTEGGPLLLVAHYDTVWPLGTLENWPFTVEGDRAAGPGVFDMKAGLVQAVWGVKALQALNLPIPSFTLLITGDEETGSLHSSDAILAEARTSRAALVFEASADGAVKTARKGMGLFEVTVEGVESHAGLDPEAGASAVHEIAHQILELAALGDPAAGTTLNVGTISGGSRANVVAGTATAAIDIRIASATERDRLSSYLSTLEPANPRTRVRLGGGWNRPPFERTEGVADLYRLAAACGDQLGIALDEVAVGGASDGNFIVDAGTPVLDGLGAVGAGAHARNEHITISGMTERAALAASLIAAFAT